MLRTIVTIGLSASLLVGCISAEERAARNAELLRQQQAYQDAQNKAYTERLHAQCAAIGYQRGSEGMRQCVLQLHSNNQAQSGQLRAILLQQMLQQQREDAYRAMPTCSSVGPGLGAYMRAQGTCR